MRYLSKRNLAKRKTHTICCMPSPANGPVPNALLHGAVGRYLRVSSPRKVYLAFEPIFEDSSRKMVGSHNNNHTQNAEESAAHGRF
jgi:hypothetical protein